MSCIQRSKSLPLHGTHAGLRSCAAAKADAEANTTTPAAQKYIPQCHEDGSWKRVQCDPFRRWCFCVDKDGQPIWRTPLKGGKGPCKEEHVTIMKEHPNKPSKYYVPQCTADGQWRALQCDAAKGSCWCVNEAGKKEHSRDVPRCLAARMATRDSTILYGKYMPQCALDGTFKPQQCTASGLCWCVKPDGKRVPNTVKFGEVQCDGDLSSCQSAAATARRSPPPDKYIPQCLANGTWNPIQCDGDKHFCWCVTPNGDPVKGTKVQGTPTCLGGVQTKHKKAQN